ncbi:MAG TPA: alpha/beta hydrolase [Candidatus Nanoarchaeia archaeon]|nr:alpha/beta hydrolase [Candidatus Nanoarchaeia archaeon]
MKKETSNLSRKNCIIIHGCPSKFKKEMDSKKRTYDKHWIPWIKKELVAKGIETENPLMPKPWKPNYKKFKSKFEKYSVNEKTILIGHSCGCAFLVRWLGETKRKIFRLILVAPWKIPNKNDKFRKAFYEYQIDKTIKFRVKKIIMFTANNEEEDGKKSLKIFHKKLDGKIVELKGRGHYTLDEMGTKEFPELLREVLNGTK